MTHTCRRCSRTTEQTDFFRSARGEPLSLCVECMAAERKTTSPETARSMAKRFARDIKPAIAKMKREGTW